MSIHTKMTSEAAAALASQKKKSTISALIVALLCLFLIGLILFVIALTGQLKSTPEIISYSTGVEDAEVIEKPEMTNEVQRKPSAPSSSMAKVIAANMASPAAVPVPEFDAAEVSLDFGNGDDFGDGWGNGDGSGSGSGGASFFNQKVSAERICFVIDYSASMRGQREALMRAELARSVGALPDSIEYQLIFFAGPAWVAGSEINGGAKSGASAVVTYKGKEYKWGYVGHHGWSTKERAHPAPEWKKASKANLKNSLKTIAENRLVYGTAWEAPLLMALDMDPKPDQIFFMTDGRCGDSSARVARDMGTKAKKLGVKINAIAMMDPRARDAMGDLSQISGGQFSMVNKDGSTEILIKAKK